MSLYTMQCGSGWDYQKSMVIVLGNALTIFYGCGCSFGCGCGCHDGCGHVINRCNTGHVKVQSGPQPGFRNE